MSGGNNFKVYKSSAGSGKTYTLVKEYLKIVLANPDKMHEVLAITFTNAAAAQMKGRIIKELASISQLGSTPNEEDIDNDLLKQILSEYRMEQSHQVDANTVVHNASKVLEKILHNYSDFSVSTIDSFVHRIIRSFAFDLQVPVNFEVESDANRLLSQAIDMVIAETGNNKQLTQFLVNFVSRQAEEDKSLGVEKMIGNLALTLMSEDGDDYLEKLQNLSLDDFLKIEKGLASKTREIENTLQKNAMEAMEAIKAASISSGSFYQSTKGIYSYLERFSKSDFSKFLPNSYVKTTLEEDKWISGKATQTEADAIEGIKYQLQNQSGQIIEYAEQSYANYQLLSAVTSNIFPLGVLNEVKRALEGIKKEDALLHFSDFNKKISKIVAEQPVPFIYERVGERYKHYMIDEFQDTSILQWQNLLPLVDNGLSTGNKSLIVGDGKQAIYRWRGGEVEQFVNLPNIPEAMKAEAKPQWQSSLQRNYSPEFLKKNWRSREKIIEFNNQFFDFAKQYLDENLQKIYLDAIQEPAKKGSGGFVQVSFLQNQDYVSETIERVLKTVEELQQAGHPLSDIAILCRSNKNGSLIAKHLMLNKKPVISPDSLLLNQSDEVVFILSLLKLLANKNDVVAACEAINFLLQEKTITIGQNIHEAFSKSGHFPVFSRKGNTNWHKVLKEMLKAQGVEFDLNDLRHLSVYDATEEIARTFFVDKSPSPFVNFFIDHLLEYSEKGNQGVADFVQWWDKSSRNFSVVTPEGVDAVQVMSIHKSKGLEFPVVIFPFASISRNKPTKNGFWVSPTGCKELEALPAAYLNSSAKHLEGTIFHDEYLKEKNLTSLDNMNIFYVALTRAEEKLFVFSQDSKTEMPSAPQYLLKSFVESNQDFRPTGKDGEFSFGENWQKSTTTIKPLEQIKLEKLFSRSWSDALRVASKQEIRGGTAYEKRERGVIFHGAMEKVLTLQDLWPVLEGLVAQGLLEEETAREWEQNLGKILSDEEVSDCFSTKANIKTEPGLFDNRGNFLRPDRVTFFNNRTVIIDYKSGQGHPNHKKQVDNYAQVLESMGYENVKKYLLYLDEPRLVVW